MYTIIDKQATVKQIVPSKRIDILSMPTYFWGKEYRNMMYGYHWCIIDDE
ncbi:hypothetical protein [Anaerosacchariphilus polymeriproducens]|nr:hypothetical protein [Anaerosacchariphilus polymeriproducens]